ncbi:MAG TPA: hypothetical protein VGN73_14235 [Gemmatimonadaceae bacterium]|nr:hypothetical protein [Gemmatimonadaceae bacterium]
MPAQTTRSVAAVKSVVGKEGAAVPAAMTTEQFGWAQIEYYSSGQDLTAIRGDPVRDLRAKGIPAPD